MMGLSEPSGNTELWASNCEQTMCLMTKAKSILGYIRRIIFCRSLEAILPIHSALECLTQVQVMKKRSQTLLMNTHRQERRRWAQIKIYEIPFKYMKKIFLLWGWSNSETNHLEKLLSFHPWTYSKPDWT